MLTAAAVLEETHAKVLHHHLPELPGQIFRKPLSVRCVCRNEGSNVIATLLGLVSQAEE